MNPAIGNTPKEYAVVPFYATAAVVFFIFTLLMFIAAPQFTAHYFHGKTLALVHTAALGWATMIIFGAAYQLLPVIFERNLYSSILALASYFFLLAGSILLIFSFWYFSLSWGMISGGISVIVAVLLYCFNVFKTADFKKNKLKIQNYFIISSALYLLITCTIGLLLVINLAYPFFNISHLEILKLHAHLGIVGWFLQLITGISVRLVPMFLLSKSNKSHLLSLSFIFQNVGILGFTLDRYFTGSPARSTLYLILVGVGIFYWLFYLRDTYKNRLKRKVEVQMKFAFISFGFLIASLFVALLILNFSDIQWSTLYGTFIFLGWISAIILGKTFKTLPFIIWNTRYKTLHGKMKLPMPKDLYIEQWIHYQYKLFVAAMLLLTIGIVSNILLIIKAGLFLWILIATLYIINIFKILFHKKQLTDGTSNNRSTLP
ncbi:MAG TPA: hypothetical protein VK102_10780 [Sphingobacterium sp.]|nr:hypothetical protein [Sphingobacterium sp.]